MADEIPQSPPVTPVTSLYDPRAVQILSTEHWSLLSARALSYNEAFVRGGMFLTFLSMSFVALALLAQAMSFGDSFLTVAAVVLAFDLVIGLATYGRISGANIDDLRAVVHASVERRHREMPAAEHVIGEEVEKYWQWVAGLAAVPVVTQFREEMNRMRERELAAALRRFGDLTIQGWTWWGWVGSRWFSIASRRPAGLARSGHQKRSSDSSSKASM